MSTKIPIWIMVWGLLMALLPLGFASIGYFNPGFFGEMWAAEGFSKYGTVLGFYISRNMASGLIMVFALSQRSASMLIVAFLMRILSDVFDTIHQILAGTINGEFVFFASALIVVSSLAIYKLWGLRENAQ